MKRYFFLAVFLTILLSACSPKIHIDLLGTSEIREVVLVPSESEEKILLLDISGIISTTLNPGFFEREGDILSQVFYRLQKASEDKTVKGVILRLDTPGGEVTASDILYNEIKKFKEKTEEEKEIFQSIIDDFYLEFLKVAHRARQNYLSMEELKKIADGRVFTAPNSKTNIYASGPKPTPLLERQNLQDLLPSLKSGFYYLWLPMLDDLLR